jgi:undecaprenyl-diphosphatase
MFEGCVVLFMTQKKYIGIPALVLCTLVALSRLYLYVHYPSDVITGAILGTLFAVLAVKLVNRAFAAYEQKHEKQVA